MANRIFKQNALILAKIESSYGVDASPSASANAYLVRNLDINPMEGASVDLEYIRPWFGQDRALRVSNYVTMSFDCDWVPGVASVGLASAFDTLLKACGLSSTSATSAVTGTAQAGASSSITLASGASSTTNIFRGATITTTGGTGDGQSRNITAYNGSTKVATVSPAWDTTPDSTTTYSIGGYMVYDPVSAAFDSATLYYNAGGVQHIVLGARGTLTLEIAANAIPSLKFSFTGLLGTIDDVAISTPTYTGFGNPVAVNSTNTTGQVFSKQLTGGSSGIQLSKLTFDLGNQVNYRLLVGSESVVISGRKPKGSLSIEMTSVAFYDWFTAVKNGTTGYLAIQNGTVAGQRVRIDLPKAQLENPKYSESDGIVMLDLDYRAIWTSGNDEVRFTEK